MKMQAVNREKLIRLLSVSFIGILFLMIFATWSSPLYPNYNGGDSSFFTIVGQAIVKGKVMYRDYVDIKGPVFFFIEALSQFICYGRLGVFIVESLVMVASLVVIDAIVEQFSLKKSQYAMVLLIFFVFYSGMLFGGNTAEEFFLPFLLLNQYQLLKYVKNNSMKALQIMTLNLGLTFGLCLFSKITVFAPSAAIAIFLLIYLIKNKKCKAADFIKLLFVFVVPVAIIAIPIFIYYQHHNVLNEMLLWSFRRAFVRGIDGSYGDGQDIRKYIDLSRSSFEMSLLPAYAGIITSLINIFGKKKKDIDYFILIQGIVLCIALHLGTPYKYYFIIELPMIILLVVRTIGAVTNIKKIDVLFESWNNTVITLGIIISAVVFAYSSRGNLTVFKIALSNKGAMNYYVEVQRELFDLIPEDEIDQLYPIGDSTPFYMVNDILPESRYVGNTYYFYNNYPDIKDEIDDIIINKKAKWLISKENLYEFFDGDTPVALAIEENYVLYADNNQDKLYRVVDEVE